MLLDGHDTNGTKDIRSLSRGLGILAAFSHEKREFSVVELAQRLEVSRPTAYRLARSLEQHGFLRFDPATRKYSIGPVAFAVGSLFLPPSFSVDVGEIMRDLRSATTHTVHVAVVDGTSLLNIGAEESLNLARAVFHAGQRTPMHATAAGKAYLASLPTARVLEIVAETGLPRVASRTITELDHLLADLEVTRRRGYGVAINELAEGLQGFAMLVGANGPMRPHTIAVSLPTGVLRCPEDEEPIIRHLRQAANRLAGVLGQHPRWTTGS